MTEIEALDAYDKSSTSLSKENFIKKYKLEKNIHSFTKGFSDREFENYRKELETETIEELEKKLEGIKYIDLISRPSFTLALTAVIDKKDTK